MHRLNMRCIKVATENVWGPFSIEGEFSYEDASPKLTPVQLEYIYEHYKKVIPVIRRGCPPGIWVWSTCTRECRHAFFS